MTPDGHEPATPNSRVGVHVMVDGLDVAGRIADVDDPSLVDPEGRRATRFRSGAARVAIAGEHALGIRPAVLGSTRQRLRGDSRKPSARGPMSDSASRTSNRTRQQVHDDILTGWAGKSESRLACRVHMIVDGVEVAAGRADLDRPKLAAGGLGDGRHGFEFALPEELPLGRCTACAWRPPAASG